MSAAISKESIINAVLSGYVLAQKKYEKMSDGYWLWEAPEYFVTTLIAEKLWNLEGSKYITLEHDATDILEEAGAKGRGKVSNAIRKDGRVDILLWWASKKPRVIIEVKNKHSMVQYSKDIKRIKAFLERKSDESSLQFGVFSFYESATEDNKKDAKQKIIDRIDKVRKKTEKILGDKFKSKLYTTKMHKESEDLKYHAWQVACIVIELKK